MEQYTLLRAIITKNYTLNIFFLSGHNVIEMKNNVTKGYSQYITSANPYKLILVR